MKSGVSLQQMLTEVKRQSESKEDYLIAPNRLRMESYGKEMFLHLSDDSGTELIEPVNADQAASAFFDDGKRIFGGPFPCDVAACCAKCSGDALVHMKQQNVAERFILDVRHHKLGAAGSLCFLLGDCREAAPQVLQHIQPPDGAGDKQKRQQQCAAHKRGDGYDDAHKNACAIPDGIVRFHCRLPSFHKKQKGCIRCPF